MELHTEVPADTERLNAQVVAREHDRRFREQAAVTVVFDPRTGRDEVLTRAHRRNHGPADFLTGRLLHLAARGHAERLATEADTKDRHAAAIRLAQPVDFLTDPGVRIVDGGDRTEHDNMIHTVESRQDTLIGEQVNAQRRAPRLEGLGDETARIHVVVTDDDNAHGWTSQSFGAKLTLW